MCNRTARRYRDQRDAERGRAETAEADSLRQARTASELAGRLDDALNKIASLKDTVAGVSRERDVALAGGAETAVKLIATEELLASRDKEITRLLEAVNGFTEKALAGILPDATPAPEA